MPLSHPRRALTALAVRDPAGRAVKRSVRAAVMVPLVFALGRALSSNAQLSVFAAFGAFAVLLMVDFPGSRVVRLRSYGGLCLAGLVFIALGTAISQHAVWAVVGMAAVAFLVLFAGVFSPTAAAASTGALLTFVLPVCIAAPTSQIPSRIAGWLLACVFCVPAAILVWPGHWHDGLRRQLAEAARALAIVTVAGPGSVGAGDPRRRARDALTTLRSQFERTPYPPTGSGPGDMAVCSLVSRIEWVGDHVLQQANDAPTPSRLPGSEPLERAIASVLDALAAVVEPKSAGDRRPLTNLDALEVAVVVLRREWTTAVQNAAESVVSGPPWTGSGRLDSGHLEDNNPVARVASEGGPPTAATDVLGRGFQTRVLAAVTVDAAQAFLDLSSSGESNAGFDTLHRGLAEARSASRAIRDVTAAHVSWQSVWLRNTIRGAIALALAVTVVEITDVSHGFWVVLGTLSVLRSNAMGTGANALRAIGGTVLGFVIGSLVMIAVGDHHLALWAALPFAVLAAGVAPTLFSFTAGQAGFTLTVVILFNIIDPTGWHVGLVRVMDVAIGAGVSVVVGLIFWPRGATRALGGALVRACAAYSLWFAHSVELIGSRLGAGDQEARRQATFAYRRLNDAVRQYLAERGEKTVSLPSVTRLVAGANGIRLAASALDLPLPSSVPVTKPVSPAVASAHQIVDDACTDALAWFDDLVRTLPHGVIRRPSPDNKRQRRAELATALDEAHRLGLVDEVRAVLLLRWAEEGLEAQLELQAQLHDQILSLRRAAATPLPTIRWPFGFGQGASP